MENSSDIKTQFFNEKENLFNNPEMQKNSFKLCISYSLLVEEFIYRALASKKLDCVLAASGSFSRRELSPYSDIDLMIISDSLTYADVFPALEEVSSKLQRSIQPTIYSFNELTKRIQSDNSFIKRVMKQPKIWIIGKESELPAG